MFMMVVAFAMSALDLLHGASSSTVYAVIHIGRAHCDIAVEWAIIPCEVSDVVVALERQCPAAPKIVQCQR